MSAIRVLIAEDHEVLAQFLTELMQDAGYEVATTAVGDARRMVDLFEPRVVLIGYNGRGGFSPGWEAATAVARTGRQGSLVRLTTSEHALAEIGRTWRGKLFSTGLLKPFHLDDLVNCVRCAVNCEPPTPMVEAAQPAKQVQEAGCGPESARSARVSSRGDHVLRDYRHAEGEALG